jgi:hypothetical protein
MTPDQQEVEMNTIRMTLPSGAVRFRTDSGPPEELVYLVPWPEDGQVLYRRGRHGPYHTLACWGLGGHAFDVDHELYVGDPHDHSIERLGRKDPWLSFKGVMFVKVDPCDAPKLVGVVPLPPEVRTDDVFRLPDKRLIHLSGTSTSNELWVHSLRASIGWPGEPMRPIHVRDVHRCSYGAWIVESELGTVRIFPWFGTERSRWGQRRSTASGPSIG